MSMHEIDILLVNSINFIKNSNLTNEGKRQIIWNLEQIPEKYSFDAGSFQKKETDLGFSYISFNIYEIGLKVLDEINDVNANLVYDWSAFLLNFQSLYFSEIDSIENLKQNYFIKIKNIFHKYDFSNYSPLHQTLTIYDDGSDWFSEEQNALIRWFCSNKAQ